MFSIQYTSHYVHHLPSFGEREIEREQHYHTHTISIQILLLSLGYRGCMSRLGQPSQFFSENDTLAWE